MSAAVRLESNGAYWRAVYHDHAGALVIKSLGAKSDLPRPEAERVCRDLARAMRLRPLLRAGAGTVPTVGAWLRRYAEDRAGLSAGSLDLIAGTSGLLAGRLGTDTLLADVTTADAQAWRAWLKTRTGAGGRPVTTLTVRRHLLYARGIFAAAVRAGVLGVSPFEGVREPKPKRDRTGPRWAYIDAAATGRLLEAAPTPGWRAMIALCRWGGCRSGEAHGLTWDRVDLEHRRFTPDGKTGPRTTPMTAALEAVLREAFGHQPDGAMGPCWGVPTDPGRRHKAMRRIVQRAGVPPYDKPFHTLRKNCATDWRAMVPAPVAAQWLGHTEAVQDAHYIEATPAMLAAITGVIHSNAAPQVVAK